MKSLLFPSLLIALAAFTGKQSDPFQEINSNTFKQTLRNVENKSFRRGEKLTYRMHYGFIDAAVATLEITDENRKFADRNTLHVVGIGKSKGSFDLFFKVRDRYETYIDDEAIVPWVFIRRVDEGGYKIEQNQVFNHFKKQVDSDGKIFSTPDGIQDMLSAFYYARTMDFGNAKKGDIFSVPAFVDNEFWDLKIKFLGRETVKTDLGRIKCLKFCPIVQKGRIWKSEDDLSIWISDDDNHVPVRGQCEILFGSIKMDLISVKGLASDLPVVKK
ncbi:MAG: DUF3108 domain-containing protein [Bacteroidia bacterium]|nr:DUF3108 domain-containing protein [Bacteroidia bacterium]